MGVPCYGQSFVLSSAQNHGLNAPSYGPGEAGKYTRYQPIDIYLHRLNTRYRDFNSN